MLIVRFITPDEADVLVSIATDDRPTLHTDGYAIRVDNEWKVSRDTFWRFAQLRGLL